MRLWGCKWSINSRSLNGRGLRDFGFLHSRLTAMADDSQTGMTFCLGYSFKLSPGLLAYVCKIHLWMFCLYALCFRVVRPWVLLCVLACVQTCLLSVWYLTNCKPMDGISPNFVDVVEDTDELIRFWRSRGQGQGHSEVRYLSELLLRAKAYAFTNVVDGLIDLYSKTHRIQFQFLVILAHSMSYAIVRRPSSVRLSVNILRKSLLLPQKWLDRHQTCTRWSPEEPASRMCSRSRSRSKVTWFGHICDVMKCLLYSTVSRSVSICAHFMKHHYTLLPD